ncbi:hypothetical protein PR202_gb16798 [Eleusine coracana subsp. coracana]|uniref:indole-3-pyruvate monooxygenase n=1 Tax=Eleusine coracana subsp. coracana TaxID=191504 RepID=A0AAV5F1Q3_ELECO|nr:hypothetical protein PR202_gb16741 [Eleusine coracana subsp. coracana]GJN28649.1 hypothetical protein PR202_gb16798 [Eleusine coracana subsp. coracana]
MEVAAATAAENEAKKKWPAAVSRLAAATMFSLSVLFACLAPLVLHHAGDGDEEKLLFSTIAWQLSPLICSYLFTWTTVALSPESWRATFTRSSFMLLLAAVAADMIGPCPCAATLYSAAKSGRALAARRQREGTELTAETTHSLASAFEAHAEVDHRRRPRISGGGAARVSTASFSFTKLFSMEVETVVLIVGAGPAGLATAACLTKLSIPYVIVEREDCSASLWRNRAYDRLKLHLAKEFCELPHMSYPADAPTYIPKDQFVKYLDKYIEDFNIRPRYRTRIESCKYDEGTKFWISMAHNMEESTIVKYMARFLVVASGENSAENIPMIPGQDSFPGETIHSSNYKSGASYSGQKVLVVGCGNSGMEIAYDLASRGANTSIVVRSPVCILFFSHLRNSESMLNHDGLPKKQFPNHWKGANGLYCAGLAKRGLAGIAMDAKNIANDILRTIDSIFGQTKH